MVQKTLTQEALDWWYNTLTDSGRNQFPKPTSNEDIEAYYDNIAEHIWLEYGMCNF